MLGSHIDTVIDAGIYDGCYGVLAGLEAIETLKEAGFAPARPLVVAAFTNEEGVRYSPDVMGSLVFAAGRDIEEALASIGTDGSVLGRELERIGYAGRHQPGFLKPHVYVELHVEQGPVLEREGIAIGAVENLQGISWQRITIDGVANHAGTTPMSMHQDAGVAAARVISFLADRASASPTPTVATVGTIAFEPNAINVIPSRAIFTIDLRDPNEMHLREAEAALAAFLDDLAASAGVTIHAESLALRAGDVRCRHRLADRGWCQSRRPFVPAHDVGRGARRADDCSHCAVRDDLRAEPGRHQPQPGRVHRRRRTGCGRQCPAWRRRPAGSRLIAEPNGMLSTAGAAKAKHHQK